MVESLQEAPVTAMQIARSTKKDPLLAKVSRCIQEAWPEIPEEELRPFWNKRLELSLHDGCIVWGGRVVVLGVWREHLLSELHGGHPGVSRMKSLARRLVWWPGIDHQIEETVKRCEKCQQSRPCTACISSTTSLELANSPLEQVTHGLCWAKGGKDVSGHN